MNRQETQQKIRQLMNDVIFVLNHDPARKVIPKLYATAKTINQQMSTDKDASQMNKMEKERKEWLEQELGKLNDSFLKFKETRKTEIKLFNQVEYYMYEQTELILHQYQPPIIKLIFDKLNSISRIFIKPEIYHLEQDKVEVEDTTQSFSDKKPQTQRKITHKIAQSIFSTKSLPNNSYHTAQSSLQKSWQNLTHCYQSHRLDQAYNELIRIQQFMLLNQKQLQLSSSQQQLAKTIKFEYKTMVEFYEHFYGTGYTFDKEEKGISLWYKIVGEKDVAIKVEAEIDISIENFLCIASEIDLFENYIPFTYGTKELKTISRNQRIGTSKIYIPLLTDRETYFYAAAYDRLRTTGSIFFFSKTINEDLEYQQRYGFTVPKESDCIRLEYKYYILEYIPLTKTRGKIRMVSSIDLKMDYLPLFLINKSARTFSFDYMRNYHRINQKFKGSKWEKMKMQKKPLYDYFQQKIDEYLTEKQLKKN